MTSMHSLLKCHKCIALAACKAKSEVICPNLSMNVIGEEFEDKDLLRKELVGLFPNAKSISCPVLGSKRYVVSIHPCLTVWSKIK